MKIFFKEGLHNLLLYIGVCMCGFALFLSMYFFFCQYNFTVIDSYIDCVKPYINKCSSKYRVFDHKTSSEATISLGPIFYSEELVPRSSIMKQAFSFSYTFNGKQVFWGEALSKIILFVYGLIVLVAWQITTRRILKKVEK